MRQVLASGGRVPECRAVAPEGLAWPSSRQHGHTAARGMLPVVPVVVTGSGSHTLRTRGEVPELIDDAPITVRSEPLTECNLPVGKAGQTYAATRMIISNRRSAAPSALSAASEQRLSPA